ncbi:chaperone protein dnaJ 11, chloroplastic-like [Eucalyptus grandis]|uniref:chaperone protein dnaJ 11, chloroplastic-like n=1 Tax=Eucalyptus grandis TaxID=71139 RepID=UPI00192F06F5|nr:chaperone protein dnaJ 11, chloroplastic-like [Eucalyptus grandis]
MLALAVAAASAAPPQPPPRRSLSSRLPANRRRPPPPRLEPRRRPASAAAAAAAAASLYEVLRVERTASPTEIKGAYRTLAKLYHPDALSPVEAGSDGRDFLEIHDAYATLSDPSARALYDLSLGSHQQGRPSSGAAWCCPTRRWETDQCW